MSPSLTRLLFLFDHKAQEWGTDLQPLYAAAKDKQQFLTMLMQRMEIDGGQDMHRVEFWFRTRPYLFQQEVLRKQGEAAELLTTDDSAVQVYELPSDKKKVLRFEFSGQQSAEELRTTCVAAGIPILDISIQKKVTTVLTDLPYLSQASITSLQQKILQIQQKLAESAQKQAAEDLRQRLEAQKQQKIEAEKQQAERDRAWAKEAAETEALNMKAIGVLATLPAHKRGWKAVPGSGERYFWIQNPSLPNKPRLLVNIPALHRGAEKAEVHFRFFFADGTKGPLGHDQVAKTPQDIAEYAEWYLAQYESDPGK